VTRAVEYLDSLTRQEATDVALARELAAAYARIGDILGNPYQPNLGDSAGALAGYQRAVELFERLERRDRSADTRGGLAQACVGLGSLLWSTGDGNGARASYSRAIEIYDELQRSDSRFLRNKATTVYLLGQTELRFGDPRQAGATFERSQRDLESFVASNPEDFVARRALALTYVKLADVAALIGDDEAAIRDYRRASNALDSLVAARPSPEIQRLAANAWLRLADMEGSVPPAERQALARRAIRVLQPLAESDPSNAQAAMDWAVAERILGVWLADQHRDADASAALAVSVKALEQVLVTNPGYIESRRELGDSYYRRGRMELKRERVQAALDQFMKAQTLLEAADLAKQVPKVLAELYDDIGDAYAALAQQGDQAAGRTAASWYRKSDAKWTEITGASRLSPDEARLRREVSHKLASAVRP
jgi:tetratricopeptide (TPR) repeat protein